MIPDKVRQQDKSENRRENKKRHGDKGMVVGSRWKPRDILGIVAELREVLGINFQAREAMR